MTYEAYPLPVVGCSAMNPANLWLLVATKWVEMLRGWGVPVHVHQSGIFKETFLGSAYSAPAWIVAIIDSDVRHRGDSAYVIPDGCEELAKALRAAATTIGHPDDIALTWSADVSAKIVDEPT